MRKNFFLRDALIWVVPFNDYLKEMNVNDN